MTGPFTGHAKLIAPAAGAGTLEELGAAGCGGIVVAAEAPPTIGGIAPPALAPLPPLGMFGLAGDGGLLESGAA
jgi:hypothetical protein